LSGSVILERASNSSFTFGVTTVNDITFSTIGTQFFIDDPVPANTSCLQKIKFDNTKTFTDNPPPGNYYYRVRYSDWFLTFAAGAFNTTQNVLYVTFTSSAA